MSQDQTYRILEEIGDIKAHLSKIDERLLNHLEWEEKNRSWVNNSILPVFLSTSLAFLVAHFKSVF